MTYFRSLGAASRSNLHAGHLGRDLVELIQAGKADLVEAWMQSRRVACSVPPIDAPSVFALVHETQRAYLGPLPSEGEVIHERFYKLLRCPPPDRVLAVPVILGPRVVQVVYAHDETGHGMLDSAGLEVLELAHALAGAYTRAMR